ncbi:hypothetical protein COU76_04400 [Candidatus Peregrinibacteria bacterium CG10_big_fil_rev_8_21_14_0_10_49_10]|nr:MAG: hypothetical protein COU76_04400 [Candidatus Peregrinibacteria bacterium CG10_big_fil_rev_8_21_14_0_10_49_10]
MKTGISITAWYKFTPLEEGTLSSLQKELQTFGKAKRMRGLVLLAEEGVNGTVCGLASAIQEWKQLMQKHFGEIVFKDSFAEEYVFPRWFVKVRPEVVALKNTDIRPSEEHHHLSPEEWHDALEEDVVVLDTRNDYETEIGMFAKAVDLEMQSFKDFPWAVQKAEIPKDKKVLLYCTGGIRCEKALLEMEKQGYTNVYQLQGGILAYLRKFPHQKFDGECFVFDHRVSVDQELRPSQKYKLCPHCGDPGNCAVSCLRCGRDRIICTECHKKTHLQTCSKDCTYHLQRRSDANFSIQKH